MVNGEQHPCTCQRAALLWYQSLARGFNWKAMGDAVSTVARPHNIRALQCTTNNNNEQCTANNNNEQCTTNNYNEQCAYPVNCCVVVE